MVFLDVLALVLLVLFLFGVWSAVSYVRGNKRIQKVLDHTPAAALGSADVALIDQARQNYQFAEKAIRELDRVLIHDEIVPTLSEIERKRISELIDDFHHKYGL